MGKKAVNAALGRAVIKARENLPAAKRKRNKLDLIRRQKAGDIDVNTVPLSENDSAADHSAGQVLSSVTEQNDLDEFLCKAQLAGADFAAQRMHASVVEAASSNKLVGLAARKHDPKQLAVCQEKYKSYLTIPRRPPWDETTTPDELKRLETEAFLTWRRKLAELEEMEQVVLTPFERNIEIWRQLWRVVERSHVIVQILDARDPLLFRNEDLEAYVDELSAWALKKRNRKNLVSDASIDVTKNSGENLTKLESEVESGSENETGRKKSAKISVLLLNKADYLTSKQRQYWCDYFNQQNIRAVFWSAIDLKDENISSSNSKNSVKLQNLTIKEEEDNEDDLELEHSSESEEDEENSSAADISSTNQVVVETVNEKELLFNDEDEEKSTNNNSLNKPDLMTREALIEYLKSLQSDLSGFDEKNDILTVGMVGYPNVGKSSTINKLMTRKKVAVSSTPGKTKHFQTLRLDQENVMLCDCPGLVMPSLAMSKEQMILSGILSPDQMRQFETVVALLCSKFSRRVFERAYGLILPQNSEEESAEDSKNINVRDLLTSYAFIRGFMSPKGLPDCSRSARLLVKDYVSGKLLFRQAPPTIDQSSFDAGHSDWLKGAGQEQKDNKEAESNINNSNNNIPTNGIEEAGEKCASRDKMVAVGKSNTHHSHSASQVLRILHKRHLLTSDKGGAQGELDRQFFGAPMATGCSMTAHVQSAGRRISTKPILIKSATEQEEGADGRPPKKANRNQKKDKLRRIYGHLDI